MTDTSNKELVRQMLAAMKSSQTQAGHGQGQGQVSLGSSSPAPIVVQQPSTPVYDQSPGSFIPVQSQVVEPTQTIPYTQRIQNTGVPSLNSSASTPLNVIVSPAPVKPQAPRQDVLIQRMPRWYNAWKLSPDNPWCILHLPGALLYSLCNEPMGSLKSVGVIVGLVVGSGLVLLGTISAWNLAHGKSTIISPSAEKLTVPDTSKYLPTIDVK